MAKMRPGEVVIRVTPGGMEYVERLEKAVKAESNKLFKYNVMDFEMLGQWLQVFTRPEESVVETMVSDEAISAHRMQGEFMLLGLVEGADSGGAACWNIVGATDDDPLCDVVAQRNFLKHYWVPSVAEKLIGFIAELTPARALLVRPGVLACLQGLAQELIALDKLNSDDAKPFAARPNPRMDLFGDVSYDVLGRRLRAGAAARESVGMDA